MTLWIVLLLIVAISEAVGTVHQARVISAERAARLRAWKETERALLSEANAWAQAAGAAIEERKKLRAMRGGLGLARQELLLVPPHDDDRVARQHLIGVLDDLLDATPLERASRVLRRAPEEFVDQMAALPRIEIPDSIIGPGGGIVLQRDSAVDGERLTRLLDAGGTVESRGYRLWVDGQLTLRPETYRRIT